MATDDGAAYYDIVSRLKQTRLAFESVSPAEVTGSRRELVITTKQEQSGFKTPTFAIEELSTDPLMMKGQILSCFLEESKRVLLVGIDPGSRIGVVVFYGGMELGAFTANSIEGLERFLVSIVGEVPHSAMSVKIGAGEPRSATRLAVDLRRILPRAVVEMVDESGTSAIKRGTIGTTRDQRAAVRIAFRKGVPFEPGFRHKRRSRV